MTATPANDGDAPILELRSVTKRFGGVTALSGVDFDVRPGEIHAVVGENGAGKSTLIRILAGIHCPDSGRILMGGAPTRIHDVTDADRLGIRVIHQELSLVPELSIAENIYLGREPHTWGWLHRRQLFEDAEKLVASLHLPEISAVRARVGGLSIARKQLVEIARALSSSATVLILDEPTSALSEAETESLFATLRRLRAQGTGIIYISHRLEEISRLADRITVLRDGHSVATRMTEEVESREIVRLMVGRDILDYFHRPAHQPGAVALQVRGLENSQIHGVDLEIRHGEILGIAGLVGSGRSELARAIFGIDEVRRGDILVDGVPVSIATPGDALRAGVVLVPEDRKLEGLIMIQTVAFNIALPWTRQWNPSVFPDLRRRTAIVRRAVDGFGVKLADPEQSIATLSGGNQQKALVSRWMERRPSVLILDEPTRGIDVGARKEMFSIISSLVEDGMAVLLISSDIAEVLNMAHRVALYRDGRVLRTVPCGSLTVEKVMEQLTGAADG